MLTPTLRRTLRLPVLGALLLGGVLTASLARIFLGSLWYQQSIGSKLVTAWMQQMCWTLGIQVQTHGIPILKTALLVANHISWLDIIALRSVHNTVFLAKSEIRGWPVLGFLAALSGTQFICRNRPRAARRATAKLTKLLRDGRNVTLFPEGTTLDGHTVGPFHSALFQSAIDSKCPIQPLGLCYTHQGRIDPLVPFIGDDPFLSHLWRILGLKHIQLDIYSTPPINPTATSRVELAQSARQCLLRAIPPTDTTTMDYHQPNLR